MPTLNSSWLDTAVHKVAAKQEELKRAKAAVSDLMWQTGVAVKNVKYAEEALAIGQTVAEETQRALALELTGLADEAVHCLFPKYVFVAEAVHRGGRLEIEFSLIDAQGNKTSPLLSNGGGVVDLLAFALRVVGVKLVGAAPLIVLDEPFRFINTPSLRSKAAELVRQLHDELGVQFLMISQDQNQDLLRASDVVVEF